MASNTPNREGPGAEVMAIERFEDLAAAYGPVIADWPGSVQDAATRFVALRPEAAEAALRDAAEMDDLLAPAFAASARMDAAPAPSAALMARILADAAVEAPAPTVASRRPAAAEASFGARVLTLLFGEASPLAAGALGGAIGVAAAAGLAVGIASAPAPVDETRVADGAALIEYAFASPSNGLFLLSDDALDDDDLADL
ncbi:MAG: hypothetical protein AAFW46_10895 [Pseudomonadota bacterium]